MLKAINAGSGLKVIGEFVPSTGPYGTNSPITLRSLPALIALSMTLRNLYLKKVLVVGDVDDETKNCT